MNTPSTIKFPLFQINEVQNADPIKVLGYYVASTAKINVEDPRLPSAIDPSPTLQTIANYLVASSNPEITISIHGYATSHQPARERTDKIYHYAQQICEPQSHVLLGYLWPSENPIQDDSQSLNPPASVLQKIQYALQALPTALIGTFITTLLLVGVTLALILGVAGQGGIMGYLLMGILPAIAALLLLKLGDAEKLLPVLPIGIGIAAVFLTWLSRQPWQQVILSLGLILFGFGFTLIFTLVGLRLVTYFRDQYRATNYAVLDMVELIRQLDRAILLAGHHRGVQTENWKLTPRPETESARLNHRQRVKLNFLGHSMGCFVATQAIRILSDVFDPQATEGNPDSKLGKTLSLGRLVLAAADISTESIMPGRSNVLQSALRRCEEAYLFTNEGDLALRLASTAANYFSFPSRSRFFGYRLGNVTAQHFKDKYQRQNHHLDESQYGIVNWVTTSPAEPELRPLYDTLELRSSNQEHRNLQELNSLPLRHSDEPFSPESLVNCFTVFDCTDYRDYKLDPGVLPPSNMALRPIVSHALRKAALNLVNYLRLSIDFFLTQRIDTHGGYFQGQFSQRLMYELTFLGFEPLLLSYQNLASLRERTPQEFQSLAADAQWQLLAQFAQACQEKQLQVILSPQRMP
jgi:hypothetical protein